MTHMKYREFVVTESLKKGEEENSGRSVLKDQKTGENIFRRTTSGWHSNATHGVTWHEDMIAKHPDLANSVPHDVSHVFGRTKTDAMESAKLAYNRAKEAGFKDTVKVKHSVGKPYQDETAGYKSVTHDHTLDFHDADTGEHMGSAKFKVPYSEHGRSSDISELRHRNPDSLHVNPDYVKAHNLHDDPFKGKIDPKRDYYTGARLQDGVRPAYDEFAKLHKQKKAGKWATGTSKSEGMMSDPSHYNYDHHVSDQEALHRFTEHLRKEGVQVHASADGKISGTDAKGKHHTVTIANGKIHHSVYPEMTHVTNGRSAHPVTL